MSVLSAAEGEQMGGEVVGGTVQIVEAALAASFALLRPAPRFSFLLEVRWIWVAEAEAACGALQADYESWNLGYSEHGVQATAAAAWPCVVARR